MTKKGAKRLYLLVQLKRAKVPPEEMVQFHILYSVPYTTYAACIQSVLPYSCLQVCHFSLPKCLSLTFEWIPKRALRISFGHEVHCSDALSRSGLVTLEQRRTELCKKLFNKIVENPLDILHPLIPFNDGPSKALRNSRSYRVKPCKTNRCCQTYQNAMNTSECRKLLTLLLSLLWFWLV